MYFASDNWAGASEPVMNALMRHKDGYEPAYGDGPISESIEQRFQDIFETECAVFVVGTGTAANALALSALTGPAGTVFCHKEAHIRVDECGAPEFLTSGARMWGLDGKHGKLSRKALQTGFQEVPHGVVHHGQPSAVSLTQATEAGTLYSIEEITQLSAQAKDNGLAVHMDGARFANALVTLGVTPAEMTWKAGLMCSPSAQPKTEHGAQRPWSSLTGTMPRTSSIAASAPDNSSRKCALPPPSLKAISKMIIGWTTPAIQTPWQHGWSKDLRLWIIPA